MAGYIVKNSCFLRDSINLRGRFFIPEGDGPFATVIISHGFGECAAETERFARVFASAGIAALALDFFGGSVRTTSDGLMTEMSVLTEKADLSAVMDQVVSFPEVDGSRLFLFGDSQGGFVSAMVAAGRRKDVKGLILFYPALVIPDDTRAEFKDISEISDVCYRFGNPVGRGYHEAVYNMDAFAEIAGYDGPVLIIHGDEDNIVPLSYSQRADEEYSDSRLVIIPGAFHGFHGSDFDYAMSETVSFIKGLSS